MMYIYTFKNEIYEIYIYIYIYICVCVCVCVCVASTFQNFWIRHCLKLYNK